MRIGYPIALTESSQKGLLWRAQKPAAAPGCPIDFEQAAQFEFLPQGRAQQGKEAGEAVAPSAQPSREAQQDIGQQGRPHLPADGVGGVAEEVRQLEGLFDLFEEHLDAPAAAVKIGDGLGAPRQVVGQKNHFPKFAVHLDQGHDAAQPDGIDFFDGRAGQGDQIVAQEVPVHAVLKFADDPATEIFFGAGDPEHVARGQVGQMSEVHIGLIKDDNLPGPHTGAHFAGAEAFVFAGGVHQGEARQESLQVEPEMALGGGLAAAMFGPVQTAGDQLDGGGVHQMDHAFETEGKARTAIPAKTGVEFFQMAQDGVEEVLGHLGGAFAVGGGKRVLAGRGRAAHRRERSRMQPQGVADIVEADGVSQLGVKQTHHMTPRREGSGAFEHARIPRQFRHQMRRNKIAELMQEREAAARWLVRCGFIHPLTCGRFTRGKPTLFYPSTGKSTGRL